MKYTVNEIASVIGAPTALLADGEAMVSWLLTDSRSLTAADETLFFALRTHNNDGHHYVAALYDKGVRHFVVKRDYVPPCPLPEANLLQVDDPLDALQALATYHRRRFRQLPVIGITGSRGKTTVKEWLYQLLAEDYHIVRSPRSYNSQIGVPLSLWDIDEHTSLAIIEAGISTTGEMANLQAMIRPTIGVITNIGSEHNNGFASMNEKAQEKARILYNCDCVVYPADDPLVTETIAPLLEVDVAQVMAWSLSDARQPLFIKHSYRHGDKTDIRYVAGGTTGSATIPFTDERDVHNAITCLAVLLHLGIKPEVIAERMLKLTPVGTRISVIEGVNNSTVIVDGYTSDYNSLTPALDFMKRRTGTLRETVIMSDLMPEAFEGDELYIRVSELLRNKGIYRLLGIGPDMCRFGRYFANSVTQMRFFASTQQFLDQMTQGDFEDETILLKGAPEFGFEQIQRMLEAKQHQTVEEVDLNALAHNFKFFKSRLSHDTKTVGMVKASGYGAGSYEIAKTLQDSGCNYLAVAVQDEGVDLRKAGITTPIIVLNPSVVNYKAMFNYRLEPEVYTIDECRELIRQGERYGVKQFPVHVKVDTGMHRLGFTFDELPELLALLRTQDVLHVSSVFSHLSVADEPGQDDYTRNQMDCFERCAALVQQSFTYPVMRHILNTAGIVRFPDHQYDMVRIGIGLYGIKTVFDGSEDALLPVSKLHVRIISLKTWPAGTTIGYGRRGVLARESRIATLAIGYADGMDRHFGNGRVNFWVNGTLCPTVGNVCMDAVMIDVTDAECRLGDRAELFGPHLPIEQLAEARGTIPYEILTSISPRVKRVYYRE